MLHGRSASFSRPSWRTYRTSSPGAAESEDGDAAEANDADESLRGETAKKAAAEAASAAAGGGDVESDDGGAGYEVELRAADGTEIEVELDESFAVVRRRDD